MGIPDAEFRPGERHPDGFRQRFDASTLFTLM